MGRISVTKLKKKYRHPVRAIQSRGFDYCVGGALCHEVGMDHDFPNEQQLKDAILKANPDISWYELSDTQIDEIYYKVKGITAANDVGDFDLAWKLLGDLLNLKMKRVAERRGRGEKC